MSLYERAVERAHGDSVTRIDWFTTAVRVHTPFPAVHDYVAGQHHITVPAFPTPPSREPVDLYALADSGLLSALRSLPRAHGAGRRESFRGWWYECHETPDGALALLAGEGHEINHALLTRDFREWAVVAARPEQLGLVVTRTVRELVREDLLGQGALMLHAAAAVLPDGTGVLLAGASGAGKTSAAVRVAQAGGRCVGTDRTFLLRRGGRWLAVGLPMSTRLARGSADALGVAEGLGGRTPIRAEGHRLAQVKLSLSNAEVHELVGGGFTPAAAVGRLIVLDAAGSAEPRVVALPASEAKKALGEHLLVPDPAYRSRWLAPDPAPERTLGTEDELFAATSQVPALGVAWDPASHCDEHTARLLSGVPASSEVTR